MRRPSATNRGVTFEPIRHRTRRKIDFPSGAWYGPGMNAKPVAPSKDRISGRLVREALDREVRAAAPLPVADAAVDLLSVLLTESLSVRG